MNPSPPAIEVIRERVAAVSDWARDDAEILADLESEAVANPEARVQIPAPLSESIFLGLLNDPSNGSVLKLIGFVNFHLVKRDIDESNRAGLNLWSTVLPVAGLITQGEADSIKSVINGTVPDPAWSETVSAVHARIGRAIDVEDIRASRPERG